MATIIVIDDSPGVTARVKKVLEAAEHAVATAHDWAETRGLLTKFEPDLVLVDVNLPGFVDGSVLAAQLQKYPQCKNTKIAFYSGASERDLQAMVERSGALGYIKKGLGKKAFIASVEKLLNPEPEEPSETSDESITQTQDS